LENIFQHVQLLLLLLLLMHRQRLKSHFHVKDSAAVLYKNE